MKKKILIIGISLAVTAGLVGVGLAAELNHAEKTPRIQMAGAEILEHEQNIGEFPLREEGPKGNGRGIAERTDECDECGAEGHEGEQVHEPGFGAGERDGLGPENGKGKGYGSRESEGNGAGSRGNGIGNGRKNGNESGYERGSGEGSGNRRGAVS